MKKFISEFKEFISKGNVLDMAVGVIIGGAFSKIVSSLVNDVMMPLIGVIIGGHDFTNLSIKVGNAKIMYGSFLQNVVDFLIVAFCLFIVIKIINRFKRKQEKIEKKENVKTPSEEVVINITKKGFAKRLSATEYKAIGKGGKGTIGAGGGLLCSCWCVG